MSRTFEIHMKEDPAVVLDRAKAAAKRSGALFEGDLKGGTFSGSGVEGTYVIEGNLISLTVTEKPPVIPWSIVETMVHSFFAPAPDSSASDGAKGSKRKAEPKTPEEAARRKAKADEVIKEHILWSVGVGLVPIPLFDVAAVTALQIGMLKQLSKLYDVDHDQESGKIFVSALAGTSAAKIGASLIKAIPGVGSLVGSVSMSALSGASTYALGQVACTQLEMRGTLKGVDLNEAKRAYEEAFERGKEVVKEVEKNREAAADNGGNDPVERLKKLKGLLDNGLISEDEFEAKRAEILANI